MMGYLPAVKNHAEEGKIGTAERDIIALGIAIAAIIMFIGTGGSVLPDIVRALLGDGAAPDAVLTNALLLNIALIVFGWRRYNELTREIGERRRAEETARKLAETDPLTGCLNRRSLAEATEQMRRKANASGRGIAFVMIDLDNFKQVNDLNGHIVGDGLLMEIAARMRAELPPDALLARIGGDEFAFAMSYDPSRPGQVDEQVLRLFEGIGDSLVIDGLAIETTMSAGIAADHEDSLPCLSIDSAQDLMHRADMAMYQAKKQGKNHYRWFEIGIENEIRFRNEIEAGIRRGLAKGEFVPFYEQQVDLETGEIVGFEMLARWQSPELGLVSPEIFIPLAEDMGVIAELSEQLIRQAFSDAQEWDSHLTLAVNISPLQLRDEWFAQKLLKLMVEQNFPAQRLDIEVTESCLHEDVDTVRSMLQSLKNQGVRVSLDDFGTGYSSLAQLQTLPFDRLKIDRSFIAEMKAADTSTRIVDAIISLGQTLDMPIIAEGIEDEKILSDLRKMGRLKGQGYLYGRPETSAQVRERLKGLGLLSSVDKGAETAPTPPSVDLPGKKAAFR